MKRNLFICVLLCLLTLPVTSQATEQDYLTAYNYTVQFYPRWFTWVQSNNSYTQNNMLSGPDGMGPDFKVINAVNDDTIYARALLDLSSEPQILTIPSYSNVYSVAILDVFGNIIVSASMPTKTGATYALLGPNFTGTLPDNVIPVQLPYNSSELFVRTDKYSSQGVDWTQAAKDFRAALKLQSLSGYKQDPSGGQTVITPLSYCTTPIKRMADEAIANYPTDYLNTLQEAMNSSTTEPLTASDQTLISEFNSSFNAAKQQTADTSALSDIIRGVQAAHTAIIDHWRSNTGATNWIHFNNMGHWGENYLDRASANEYIQFANDIQAAYYAHAFVDSDNIPLDGSNAYTITFTKDNVPQFSRFVSVTAYTPEDIELVSNSYNKYLVASYTPGLTANSDGSITFYIQATPPTTAPIANWLPVPASGPFNLMLRIYGPTSESELNGTYTPPAIKWKIGGVN